MCEYSIILGNRSNVPHPPDLNNTMYLSYFVAFKRDLLVSINFDFAEITSNITAIELSFLNSPTNGISLPDIAINEIERGTMNMFPIESRILDNQDLAYTDNQIRTVFIQPDMLLSRINLNMRFEFSIFHDFDWLFLSEVRFCTDSQMSQSDSNSTKVAVFTTPIFNTVQPSANDLSRGSIELVCSVSSEGRYMWVWERDNIKINNTSKYQITVRNGSRTTVLKIFKLSFSDIAKYKCQETTFNQIQFAEFSVEYPGKESLYI